VIVGSVGGAVVGVAAGSSVLVGGAVTTAGTGSFGASASGFSGVAADELGLAVSLACSLVCPSDDVESASRSSPSWGGRIVSVRIL
jgi:hypothetical protein